MESRIPCVAIRRQEFVPVFRQVRLVQREGCFIFHDKEQVDLFQRQSLTLDEHFIDDGPVKNVRLVGCRKKR